MGNFHHLPRFFTYFCLNKYIFIYNTLLLSLLKSRKQSCWNYGCDNPSCAAKIIIAGTFEMFRTPLPNAEMSRLENCGAEQLLGIFKSALKMGINRFKFSQPSDAWGTLFSNMFLSAEELVDEMQSGEHRLGKDNERMLGEFVKVDCSNGGAFVLNVIKKGGNIDRAALIMIADPDDLASVEHNGMTAVHLLVDACDKRVRPALIKRVGNRLLSSLYDSRGIPVFFSVLSLNDLCMDDLDAITQVFSSDELRQIMSKNRTGKTALEVFAGLSLSLKYHAPRERNAFLKTHAVKTTNFEGGVREQLDSPLQNEKSTGAQVQAPGSKKAEQGERSTTSASERYTSLMSDPLDNIGEVMKNARKSR